MLPNSFPLSLRPLGSNWTLTLTPWPLFPPASRPPSSDHVRVPSSYACGQNVCLALYVYFRYLTFSRMGAAYIGVVAAAMWVHFTIILDWMKRWSLLNTGYMEVLLFLPLSLNNSSFFFQCRSCRHGITSWNIHKHVNFIRFSCRSYLQILGRVVHQSSSKGVHCPSN